MVPPTRAFWNALYDDGAEIIVNAHEHVYERFAAQDAAGGADPSRGMRQFTVGTAGEELSSFRRAHPNSQARGTEYSGAGPRGGGQAFGAPKTTTYVIGARHWMVLFGICGVTSNPASPASIVTFRGPSHPIATTAP